MNEGLQTASKSGRSGIDLESGQEHKIPPILNKPPKIDEK